MTAAINVQQERPPETLMIDSVEQFVSILVRWHGNQVKTLKHLLEVPEGTEMKVGEDTNVTLQGNALAGFKTGIEMGLMYLGELPFAMELEDAPVIN